MEDNITTEISGVKPEKKHRKRMKAVHRKIREQMEFYFGDSNLNRDRFVKKLIEESEDGYVDIEIFKKFNKIRMITMDTEVISKALSKSELLKVSDDGKKVKRILPICEPKDLDKRTVYVECLPTHVDHEWIKHTFSTCGKVSYVSLPKYKSTGDCKGFAFVEFDSIEGAQKAIEELNNPPVEAEEKPGKFPKSRKQLVQLHRKLTHLKDYSEEVEANTEKEKDEVKDHETLVKTPKKGKRQRQSTSDAESQSESSPTKKLKTFTDSDKTTTDNTNVSEHSPVKRQKTVSSTDSDTQKHSSDTAADSASGLEEVKESDSKTHKKGKKRKQSNRQDSNVESEADISADVEKDSGGKKRKVSLPKTEETESGETITQSDADVCSSVGKDSGGKKRKVSFPETEDSESGETNNSGELKSAMKQVKYDSSSDKDTKQSDDDDRKKRKREMGEDAEPPRKQVRIVKKKRKKKKQKEKDLPELRVISKEKWIELRQEYLALQKKSMQELKKTLSLMSESKEENCDDSKKTSDKNQTKADKQNVKKEGDNRRNTKIEFVPDVIVKVHGGKAFTRKQLREYIGNDIEVAYIDVKEGDTDGHIRFKDNVSTKKLLDKQTDDSFIFKLIQGEEEKNYWNKLHTDMESKYSNKNKSNKRGSQKLIDKAQKINKENVQRKHIVFTD